jgi:hypothetical protein
MIKKFISSLIAVMLMCSATSVRAQQTVTTYDPPVITPIAKGQVAPFAGVLLTPEAVAKVISISQDCPKRIQVESEHARDVQKALDDKTLADARADAERDAKIFQAGITARDGQIKDLTSALQRSESSRSNTWLWIAGGTLAGALLTVGSVALVNSIK